MFLEALFVERAERGTKVYTDDYVIYRDLLFDNEVIWHLDSEWVCGDAHTQGIESVWAMIKRTHKCTFHKISAKHMQRYVAEFAGGQNFRNANSVFQVRNFASYMVKQRKKYKELVVS